MPFSTLPWATAVGVETAAARVGAAPRLDPPFEDEHEPAPTGLEPLPLAWPVDEAGPARRPTRRREPRIDDPAGRMIAQRFAQLCVEVMNGYRPPSHLRRMLDPPIFNDACEQLRRQPSTGSNGQRPAARPTGQRPVDPIRVRRIRICEPAAGVVEAAAVLHQQGRYWAMALRLERRPEGWCCPSLTVL